MHKRTMYEIFYAARLQLAIALLMLICGLFTPSLSQTLQLPEHLRNTTDTAGAAPTGNNEKTTANDNGAVTDKNAVAEKNTTVNNSHEHAAEQTKPEQAATSAKQTNTASPSSSPSAAPQSVKDDAKSISQSAKSTDNKTSSTDSHQQAKNADVINKEEDVAKQKVITKLATPTAALATLAEQTPSTPLNTPEVVEEEPETLGNQALNAIISVAQEASSKGADIVSEQVLAIPQLVDWLTAQTSTDSLRLRWITVGNHLTNTLGNAALWGLLLGFVVFLLRGKILSTNSDTFIKRVSITLTWLVVSLLPIICFTVIALQYSMSAETTKTAKAVASHVIITIAGISAFIAAVAALLMPGKSSIRIIPLNDKQAAWALRWIAAVSSITAFGLSVLHVLQRFNLPEAAARFMANLLGLIIFALLAVMLSRLRKNITALLHGNIHLLNKNEQKSLVVKLRLSAEKIWYPATILYLIIGWIVAVIYNVNHFDLLNGGFIFLLRGTIGTVLIATILGFILLRLHRISHGKKRELLTSFLRIIISVTAIVTTIIMIMAAWGADVISLLESQIGQRILGSVLSITLTVAVCFIMHAAITRYVERKISRTQRSSSTDSISRTTSRARSLLPMVQQIVTFALISVVGVVLLSEIGVDIRPLLAGAGILGVAVGFGSQTLIKDFLTGLFIVIEDSVAIGDIIAISDKNIGTVEGMTLRTVRLRDIEGNLHIIPFSAITTIINRTRDFSYAAMTVGVDYDSDLNKVMTVMRQACDDVRHDPNFSSLILEPAEVQGVDNLEASSVAVRCHIKTRPGEQWKVKRACLQRIVEAFAQNGINIPYPHVVYKHQNGDSTPAIQHSVPEVAQAEN